MNRRERKLHITGYLVKEPHRDIAQYLNHEQYSRFVARVLDTYDKDPYGGIINPPLVQAIINRLPKKLQKLKRYETPKTVSFN